jgi:hypothetical protein
LIKEISAAITLQGQMFSPKSLEKKTNLVLTQKNEPGEMGRLGKYKNKPLPYGAANIEPPNTIGDHEKITWLATTFLEHKESIEQSGIEDLHFYIGYFYENQCNLALTASELKLIAETGLDYWFSCYGAK